MGKTNPILWRSSVSGLLTLALGLLSVACSDPGTDRCAGIDCGENGACVVVGSAPRCDCAQGFVQLGSQCVVRADAGVVTPCGNGVADEGEVCDDEDLRGKTCESLGFSSGGTLACRPTCDYFDTTNCATVCGDGLAGGNEACDSTDLGNETCESLGYYGGDLSCTAGCTFNFAMCSGRCGDGIILMGTEACDGTNLGGRGCDTVGFYSGVLTCDDCNFDVSECEEFCGDGVIQVANESCEGTDLGGADCVGQGFSGGGDLACQVDCSFDTTACISVCGNGFLDTGEVCDDGNTVDGDGCAADCSVGQGRIVFVSDRLGDFELWTMTDDGTNFTQLTFDASGADTCYGAHNPRWSPDGARIAFRYGGEKWRNCPGGDPTIYVVDADGLTPPVPILQAEVNGGLTWTLDGSHIIYTAGDAFTLRIVNVFDSVDATLYDGVNQELDPDHHPYLDRLVFSQFIGGGDFQGIFRVDTDGSNLQSLTGPCLSGCDLQSARWSSNGARVLYHRSGGIFWVSASGTQDATVLSGGADIFVDWLTDSRVVYQTLSPDVDVAVVNINGMGFQRLTTEPGYDGEPDWHPGGRDIDLDGVPDWQDNCVNDSNPSQADQNQDGIGNACP